MKNFSVIIFTALLFSACNQTAKQLKEKIINADSVAINYFKGDGSMDTVVAVKIIKDKQSIEQLTGFITGNPSSVKSNCGYDGSIHYFKNDAVIQDVFFNTSIENCHCFRFILNGKRYSTSLSGEAGKFLFAIKLK
jgi:endo-beta-N-acetylglucosaminidase D